MPLSFTPSGLTVPTQAEIVAERTTALQDPAVWGPSSRPDDPTTNLGQENYVLSEREAAAYQTLASLVNQLDIDQAEGYVLDTLGKLRGVSREPATQSLSADGQFTFTGPGTIPAGYRVRNDRTLEDWEVVADVVALGAGTESGSIRGASPGPQEFLGSDTWTILTPVANWSAFDTVGDIDPEDIGENRESDTDYRTRIKTAQIAGGFSLAACISAISQLNGVSYVNGLANRTTGTVDGVPSRAFEMVVEGGDPDEIRQAIYSTLPHGSEPYGAINADVTLPDGTGLNIGFTRPSDVSIWLRITMTTGAEYDPPFDFETLVAEAVLAAANADANPGVDVVPPAYQAVVWSTTADTTTGRPTLASVLVEGSTDGISWSTAIIPLNHKQRPDFDTARISTVVV